MNRSTEEGTVERRHLLIGGVAAMVAVCLAVLNGTGAAHAADNLLINPNFDESVSGWAGYPWVSTMDDGSPSPGSAECWNDLCVLSQCVDLSDHGHPQTLTFSGSLKAVGAHYCEVKVELYAGDGCQDLQHGVDLLAAPGSGFWFRLGPGRITTEAGTRSAAFLFVCIELDGESISVLVDDAFLGAVSAGDEVEPAATPS